MNVRRIHAIHSTKSLFLPRTFHWTSFQRLAAEMDAGVTIQELDQALRSKLSVTHTQINDISGAFHPAFLQY